METGTNPNEIYVEKIKKNLKTRLSKIEGQIRGIHKMVANDAYCDDILNQITAAISALKSVQRLLLEKHLRTCVVNQIKSDELAVVDELMKTLSRIMK